MLKYMILWLMCCTGIIDASKTSAKTFAVMTMNIWGAKETYKYKLLSAAVTKVQADIVLIQELSPYIADEFLSYFGAEWHFCGPQVEDKRIMTRLETAEPCTKPHGISACNVRLPTSNGSETIVTVGNMHLDYKLYTPYTLCPTDKTKPGSVYGGCPYAKVYQMMSRCEAQRQKDIVDQLEKLEKFYEETKLGGLMLFGGDFNSPSHQDWTPAAKDINCGKVFEWPTTKMAAIAGYIDSYRQFHPNPKTHPGHTWSAYFDYQGEKQDRIDYIWYKPSLKHKFRPVYSFTYPKTRPPTRHMQSTEWPSDHYAVVTLFTYFG